MQSLFGRLYKRRRGEDQLTESLSILSERSESFASALARLFVTDLPAGKIRIATQSPYRLSAEAAPKFIDLEIWVENENAGRACTFFIEVKWTAGEHSSAGTQDDNAQQTKNYEEILYRNRQFFGDIGLFTVTPQFNPLQVEIHPDRAHAFLATRNLFWNHIGKLAAQAGKDAEDPVFRFLAEQFTAYLIEVGLMTDSRLSIQDVLVASHYIELKRKLWPALQRVTDHLTKRITVTQSTYINYPAVSNQELKQQRFCVYRYILPQTEELAILAGLCPDDDGREAWLCTWIEIKPKFCDRFQAISSAIVKAFPDSVAISNQAEPEGRWCLYSEGWIIALKGKRMSAYVASENGIDDIANDLMAWVDELLSVGDLASLGS